MNYPDGLVMAKQTNFEIPGKKCNQPGHNIQGTNSKCNQPGHKTKLI